jgi:transcriptional regulator with GAF, ATPase, and Fis domain
MEDYEFILNLLKLSQDVISKLEFKDVIKEILKKGIEVLGVNHISLLIIEEGKSPPLAYEMYRGEKKLLKYHSTARLNKGISGMVIETKKPITINDLKNYPDANPVALKKGRRSVLAFPLTYKEKVIGIFYADSNEPNFFKESDLLKVQIFALNAGTALVNARIFEEIRYNQEKIKLLYRTSECLISSLNIKKVLKVLLKELKKSLNIKYSGVFYYDKKNNKLEIISWEGYRDKDMFKSIYEWKREEILQKI